ncbi:Vesicle-associated protein 2-2 [Camellia lanceoleosa]|uniref:Vesicle-associated protein 2-2 n=1 Tax=Camellia lanceoleosa TaxID=1840588 RepID=A0ACC0HB95_9ERIC|nr:Vesicle-associated protein 2-2 [Camellia lanceoleosa]
MQAQPSAPSDMKCKDKFLIQSTVVPFGTTEEDITPGMYVKDIGKHIEESKLKVILTSPSHLPVLLPTNGVMKQEPSYGTSVQKGKLPSGVENLPPHVIAKDVEDVKSAPVMELLRPCKDVELSPSKDVEPRLFMDVEDPKLKLGKHIEELKSKLNVLESKLSEVSSTKENETAVFTFVSNCNVEEEWRTDSSGRISLPFCFDGCANQSCSRIPSTPLAKKKSCVSTQVLKLLEFFERDIFRGGT